MLALCGCAGGGTTVTSDGVTEPEGSVTVFATASSAAVFEELIESFDAVAPQVDVRLNAAASSALAAQLAAGAPADVFVSADEATMARVVDDVGVAGEPVVIATNSLQIVVEAGNPLGIDGLADLADPDVVVVLAAPEVPVGRAARAALDAAGVDVEPRSLEASVNGVVSKVALGEADAGIAYVTDVAAAGDTLTGVVIAPEFDVVVRYPIAVLADAPDPVSARAFVEFVQSNDGRAILAAAGFGSP